MNILRIVLGVQHRFFDECFKGGYIGVDFGMDVDLTNHLSDSNEQFREFFMPRYLERHVDATPIRAGLACSCTYKVSKVLEIGDLVLSPDGTGKYHVGEIQSEYYYVASEEKSFLRHRRKIKWLNKSINRVDMSEPLRNSAGSIATICNLSNYSKEILQLIAVENTRPVASEDPDVESPSEFALEEHLEDFLVKNWDQTELSEKYEIYEDEEFNGRQFSTDTGHIDILAVSRDKKEFLVIELKKGRASDRVVGQIQRYMGYIQEEFATDGQVVKGAIIAFEEDKGIKRALSVTRNIEFYKYQIKFNLTKVS